MISSNPFLAGRDPAGIWTQLAAPTPPDEIQWRKDGRAVQRQGKCFARFVQYVDAQYVRERLDSVVPGEWDSVLELLPPRVTGDGEEDQACAFKCRLTVLGVVREDVGVGRDYKAAASDALKRAAVRFGIASDLYKMEQLWCEVDGDGQYAKALEDPQTVYDRKYGQGTAGVSEAKKRIAPASEKAQSAQLNGAATPNRDWLEGQLSAGALTQDEADYIADALGRDDLEDGDLASLVARTKKALSDRGEQYAMSQDDNMEMVPVSKAAAALAADAAIPACPKCGGRVFDNRATKRNPRAPDFKCRDRSCDGCIWPPREAAAGGAR